MNERTIEIWKLIGYLTFVFTIISFAFYQIFTTDEDLVDTYKKEKIHSIFESELKSIQLPEKFTIRNVEKHGKSGFSLSNTVTYRTRLSMSETVEQVDREFKRLGWTFWNENERNIFVYCKGKFTGEAIYSRYEPENSTDIFLSLSLGSGSAPSLFGIARPKECER
jgi:hypothetical protein